MCKPKEDCTKLSCHILEKINLLYQNDIWSLQLHFKTYIGMTEIIGKEQIDTTSCLS